MEKHRSNYDPPLAADIVSHRIESFSGPDQEMFLHIGHYISWYAHAEYMITFILHAFTGWGDPRAYNLLVKGMDARTKVNRLLSAVHIAGWSLDPELKFRLNHFLNTHVDLRNKIVHSYPYWPEGGNLQICGIGAPPVFPDFRLEAPDPEQISGLELYEKGFWLALFTQDLIRSYSPLERPLAPKGMLGTGPYLANLCVGHSESLTQRARRARPEGTARNRNDTGNPTSGGS